MPKKIDVKGVIVFDDYKWIYDWFDMNSVSPGDIEKALEEANGDDVEVYINSGGGYVYAGSEIYTLLKDYKSKVDVKITGMAGSAASVIAMAASNGGKVKMSPTAQIMIHNSLGAAEGDYRDMEHSAEILKNTNKSIANAYMLKTGMKQDELLDLMNKETFMDAQKAKELGFVDEIMFDEGSQLTNNINSPMILPPEVINKVRNEFMDQSPGNTNKPKNNEEIEKLKEKLSFENKRIDSFLFCQKQGGMNNE